MYPEVFFSESSYLSISIKVVRQTSQEHTCSHRENQISVHFALRTTISAAWAVK